MPFDPWAIDNSAGAPSYSGQELRMATVLPFMAGAGVSLGARSGVRPSGSGTDLLVQAQSSPNMTVKVNPGAAILQGAISGTQGPYTYILDAITNITIAAAHATLDRTDLICVRVRDANVDTSGARDGGVVAITGTNGGGVPSVPTDATYYILAQISVVHAVTSITSGVITDKRGFTAALGGMIPVATAALETALGSVDGLAAFRTDIHAPRYYHGGLPGFVSPGGVLIARQVLGSAVATVTFSAIPQDFTHLRLVMMARGTGAFTSAYSIYTFNGDTGSNYASTIVESLGFPSAISVSSAVNQANSANGIPIAGANSTSANAYGLGEYFIPHYSSTVCNKCALGTGFAADKVTNARASQHYGVWVSTAAITSIALAIFGGTNYATGSIFSLYGVS